MLTINDQIEGEIETIAFGGEGIMRHRGFVVFVPFTAIGDRIVCKILAVKRSFAHGILLELKHAGPNRTSPLCPYFGICGGCQLQHLNEKAQLNYKFEAVNDALKRIGHLSIPSLSIIPSHLTWAYRRHITLHLRPQGNGFEAGYIGYDNHSLVVVETCPIFNPFHHSVLKELQRFVKAIPNPFHEEGRVVVLKNHQDRFILSFQFGPKFTADLKPFQSELQKTPLWAGILVHTAKEQLILGDPYCEQKIEGLTFRFSPQTFIQNHPEQSTNIYRHINSLAEKYAQKQILDLYCGFGISSLLLAKRGHFVTGIEYNSVAIEFAKENAAFNQLKHVDFLQGDVEKILPQWMKTHEAGLVIVNPPRQGLSRKVVQSLLKASPNHLIYVSCMPSTLARDLSLLCQKQYRVQEGAVYDMFPQTAHVETLIVLKK